LGRRRDVELTVHAQQLHHFVRIDARGLANAADLVRERHLHRMKGVAGVLEHLGSADRRVHEFARQMTEDAAQRRDAVGIARADNGQRRMVVVVNRRAFAQEFGLETQAEVDAGLQPRRSFERRLDDLLDGTGLHRGAHDDDVTRGFFREHGADLFGHTRDGIEILAAVGARWRADAHERHVGRKNRVAHGIDHSDIAATHDAARQLLDAGLDDRGLPSS
jgi:hypothetical protein